MKRKWLKSIFLALTIFFVFSQSAMAFQTNSVGVSQLGMSQKGLKKELPFKKKLSYAEGVALIVGAFDLNIDHIRFIKEPKASDYYTNVPDDKWYSSSFVFAQFNGLNIPQDVDPNRKITKEEFAYHLYHAMINKKELHFIELWVMIADEESINAEYMNSIQKLIIANITQLKNENFNPTKEVSRTQAAKMIFRAKKFLEEMQ